MGGALVQSARIRAAPQTTIGRPVGRSLRKRGPQRKRGPRQSPRGIAHHRHGISRSPRRICGARGGAASLLLSGLGECGRGCAWVGMCADRYKLKMGLLRVRRYTDTEALKHAHAHAHVSRYMSSLAHSQRGAPLEKLTLGVLGFGWFRV